MDGTIGEIRLFAGDFAPKYWAFCSGQILPISQNNALFAILGTTYGGNGVNTFALPNLNSRVPVGQGTGPGLPNYTLGQVSGSETAVITASNLPLHTHAIAGTIKMRTTTVAANAVSPANNYFANDGSARYNPSGSGGVMKPATLSLNLQAGAGVGPSNLMPYTAIPYIICLFGTFPSRN